MPEPFRLNLLPFSVRTGFYKHTIRVPIQIKQDLESFRSLKCWFMAYEIIGEIEYSSLDRIAQINLYEQVIRIGKKWFMFFGLQKFKKKIASKFSILKKKSK